MMRASLLSVLLLAGAAGAQQASSNVSVTLGSVAAGDTTALNLDDACSFSTPATWSIVSGSATAACSALSVWATTAGTCEAVAAVADGGLLGTVSADIIRSTTTTDSVPFDVTQLPGIPADFCTNPTQIDTAFSLCAGFANPDTLGTCQTTSLIVNQTVSKLRIDTIPPDAPSFTVSALNESVSVHLDAVAEADFLSATLFYRKHTKGSGDGGTDVELKEGDPVNDTTGWSREALTTVGISTVSNLQNDTVYDFAIQQYDEANNASPLSVAHLATPVQSFGFYSAYRNSSGSDVGCSVGGGPGLATMAALSALALTMGWLFGRRR